MKLNCMQCGVEFEGDEPEMCCSGHMCGCMGMPTEPIVCSEKCYDDIISPTKSNITHHFSFKDD